MSIDMGRHQQSRLVDQIWVLAGLHWSTYVWFGLWVGCALAFYFAWGRHHSWLDRSGSA
jgi:hypothetical protein